MVFSFLLFLLEKKLGYSNFKCLTALVSTPLPQKWHLKKRGRPYLLAWFSFFFNKLFFFSSDSVFPLPCLIDYIRRLIHSYWTGWETKGMFVRRQCINFFWSNGLHKKNIKNERGEGYKVAMYMRTLTLHYTIYDLQWHFFNCGFSKLPLYMVFSGSFY